MMMTNKGPWIGTNSPAHPHELVDAADLKSR
jgi:hypothetical protein